MAKDTLNDMYLKKKTMATDEHDYTDKDMATIYSTSNSSPGSAQAIVQEKKTKVFLYIRVNP